MRTREAGTLHGYGRLPWTDLVSALHGTTTAWADYNGFHIGPAPQQPPPYTHLWAWSKGWLLRARIDGAQAIVAVLQSGVETPAGLTPMMSQPVRYTPRRAHTWPGGEKRVGPLRAEVADRAVDLYEVDGESPITFVALATR